jgi:hypothetical protein
MTVKKKGSIKVDRPRTVMEKSSLPGESSRGSSQDHPVTGSRSSGGGKTSRSSRPESVPTSVSIPHQFASHLRSPVAKSTCTTCGKPKSDPVHATKVSTNTPEVDAAIKAVGKVPTDIQMTADAFNVIHCRICMADGISAVDDPTQIREKLFEIIATKGWEQSLRVLASCARLFAEVPSPLPRFSDAIRSQLHQLAVNLDTQGAVMRIVDRVASGAK